MKPMQNKIADFLLAPWITGVVTAAVRLKVFTALSGQALPVDDIAAACQAVPRRLKPLLDACVSLGLLALEGSDYRNTHFSEVYFVEGKRSYVGDFLLLVNDESLKWFQLPDIIRGAERRTENRAYLRSDFRTFITAMNNMGAAGEAEALREYVNLEGCTTMVDAGGGSGLYSLTLCQKYPQLHSTIVDMKETLVITREMIAGRPETSRITLREGDFLRDPLGDNVDVVLLSDVLYGESNAGILLQNVRESLARDGQLIIRGYYADPEKSRALFGALFAVKELVDDAEKEILTFPMLKQRVADAGFAVASAVPLTEYSFVLIGRKQ
jgi:hypothetical protein